MTTKLKAQFPRRMRIGKKMYSVEIVESMICKGTMGRVNYSDKLIEVGSNCNITGHAYAACEVRDSFWHEVTHAILEDMGRHTLNRDETFVTEFANRLSKAIDSAKF